MTFRARLFAALAAAALVLVIVIAWTLSAPSSKDETVMVSIPLGTGAGAIADKLKDQGAIRSATAFKVMTLLSGAQKDLKAGDYSIPRNLPLRKVLGVIRSGKALLHKFLVKEGTAAFQLGAMLEERGLATQAAFIDVASSTVLAKAWGLPGPTLEGYLFPDTYQIARGVSEEMIAKMMVDRFKEKVPAGLLAEGAPRLSPRKVVTLASLVEKEAGVPSERARVASVFLNRMKKLKRLESCATVRFALDKYTGPVLFKDLEVESPYNTYRNFDLPPGPICSPGLEAIKAAVRPEKTNYMFFVVAGDGSHHFSETFEEHKEAKRRYLRLRRGVVQN